MAKSLLLLRLFILTIFHVLLSAYTVFCNNVEKLKRRLHARCFQKSSRTFKSDSKSLKKLPIHVGMVIDEDDVYYSDIAKMTLWCMALGVSYVTIYDPAGLCKRNQEVIQQEFELQKKKWIADKTFDECNIHHNWFGLEKTQTNDSCHSGTMVETTHTCNKNEVYIRILSSSDNTKELVSLTKDISSAVQRQCMKLTSIEPVTVDKLLQEMTNFPDLDLVLRFGVTECLMGLSPWSIRLAEILSHPSHRNIDYTSFYQLLESYAKTEQRFGK